MKTIKFTLSLLVLLLLSVSCNNGETLQGYFVEHQESPNFMLVDIPLSIIDIDQAALTDDQKEAYESINKLNMLGYNLENGNESDFKNELKKVNSILSNKKYEELMRAGNSTDGKIMIKYLGSETTIDELIVFGSMNDKGFAIIRVLGDDMQPSKILKLVNKVKGINTEDNQIKMFADFFN